MSADASRQAYVLELDADRIRHLYARGGIELEGDPIQELARALASSEPLETEAPWVLAARPGPYGLIGAVGEFTPHCVPRLEALRWQVLESLERLRYVDRASVIAACEGLAEAVRRELGQEVLREAGFTAVPRGGLIVLGHLAYLLDLEPGQLEQPDDERPWVVVDDCSISGIRFRELLDAQGRSDVVFAHLFSHPDLRTAIEADPRVRCCLAAGDLEDHAPERLGDGYAAWRSRWETRQGHLFYWVGKTDHLCFPWSEPDVGIWNPVLEREDPGWRVVPPAFCLKNRVRFDAGATKLQVLRAPGPIRPAKGVLHARLGDGIVIARLGGGAAHRLTGVGAEMWESLRRHGTLKAARAHLGDLYDVPDQELAEDLSDFAESLRAQGLLEIPQDPVGPAS